MVKDTRLENQILIPWADIQGLWERERTKKPHGFWAWWRYHNSYVKSARLVNFASAIIEELNIPYEKPKKF